MTAETQEKNEQQDKQQQPTTKWYKQPAIWAVIISVISLILSQLPPVTAWIPKEDIKVEIGNVIGLPNNLGITGYQILVDLRNIGNRSLNISNFGLEIVYPNSTLKYVEADSILRTISDQTQTVSLAITSIKLNANDGWAELIVFYPRTSPSEEEEINRFKLQMSESILSQSQARPRNEYNNPNILTEADPGIVAEAIDFFNHRFSLEKGIYKATLTCNVDGRKVILKKFEFTLYDYHIQTIKSQTKDYKYGWGIYIPSDQTKQVAASISNNN